MRTILSILLLAVFCSAADPVHGQAPRTVGSGYCYSLNGAIWGNYHAFQDAVNSAGTINNIYYWIYNTSDSRITVAWPTKFDATNNYLWLNWIDYRVPYHTAYTYQWQWIPLWAGEMVVYTAPVQALPINFPTTGPDNAPLSGALVLFTRNNFYYNNGWVTYSENNWAENRITISPGIITVAPSTVTPPNTCDTYCEEICGRMGKRNGKWKGSNPCIVIMGNVEAGQESGCDCW